MQKDVTATLWTRTPSHVPRLLAKDESTREKQFDNLEDVPFRSNVPDEHVLSKHTLLTGRERSTSP